MDIFQWIQGDHEEQLVYWAVHWSKCLLQLDDLQFTPDTIHSMRMESSDMNVEAIKEPSEREWVLYLE